MIYKESVLYAKSSLEWNWSILSVAKVSTKVLSTCLTKESTNRCRENSCGAFFLSIVESIACQARTVTLTFTQFFTLFTSFWQKLPHSKACFIFYQGNIYNRFIFEVIFLENLPRKYGFTNFSCIFKYFNCFLFPCCFSDWFFSRNDSSAALTKHERAKLKDYRIAD